MQVIQSPVTGSENVSLYDEFPTASIIEKYKELNIDVSHYFNGINTISLFTCNDTGYRFYHPFNIFGDEQFYEQLQTNLSTYYSENRWEHIFSKKFINEYDKVLEVGAGAGFFLYGLNQMGCNTIGLELNKKAIEAAKKRDVNILNELIEDHAIHNLEKYDVVCSFQVLEHISDIKGFIEECLKTLKPAGKLIIGVPFNNPYIYRFDKWHTLNLPPHHAGLWNREAFEKLQPVFNIKLTNIAIEPLREYKEWYLLQKKHFLKTKPMVGRMMNWAPRVIYKGLLRLFSGMIDGRNIVVVFEKSSPNNS